MKAKQYLEQLKKMDISINQKVKEACQIKMELKRGLKPMNYMERVQTSTTNSASFERLLIKKIDLENEINQEIEQFVTKKHKIINQIQGLEKAVSVEILYKRYVEFKKVDIIAREINYSVPNMFRLLKKAMTEFEEKYFDEMI